MIKRNYFYNTIMLASLLAECVRVYVLGNTSSRGLAVTEQIKRDLHIFVFGNVAAVVSI